MTAAAAIVPFAKASACGNDFLIIDGMHAPADLEAFSRRICDRHQGVGADGVEWLFPAQDADVRARLFNADGSEAEISGNGTRCVAAYLCSEQPREKVVIRTGAGARICTLISRSEMQYEFEIAMGEPQIGDPVTDRHQPLEEEALERRGVHDLHLHGGVQPLPDPRRREHHVRADLADVVLDRHRISLIPLQVTFDDAVRAALRWDALIAAMERALTESPDLVLVPGSTNIADLNERFGLTVPDDDYTTVGGYVFGALGRLLGERFP